MLYAVRWLRTKNGALGNDNLMYSCVGYSGEKKDKY